MTKQWQIDGEWSDRFTERRATAVLCKRSRSQLSGEHWDQRLVLVVELRLESQHTKQDRAAHIQQHDTTQNLSLISSCVITLLIF